MLLINLLIYYSSFLPSCGMLLKVPTLLCSKKFCQRIKFLKTMQESASFWNCRKTLYSMFSLSSLWVTRNANFLNENGTWNTPLTLHVDASRKTQYTYKKDFVYKQILQFCLLLPSLYLSRHSVHYQFIRRHSWFWMKIGTTEGNIPSLNFAPSICKGGR